MRHGYRIKTNVSFKSLFGVVEIMVFMRIGQCCMAAITLVSQILNKPCVNNNVKEVVALLSFYTQCDLVVSSSTR